MNKEVIIIGGGVSGMTAAIYLSRAGINTTVFTGYDMGALSETPLVENFPGFVDGISGFDLVSNITEQARKFGAIIIEEEIAKINIDFNTVLSDSRECYHYDALIVATGNKSRKIDAINANLYDNKGIHYCATCDGSLYKDKNVIVIGGGNTALTDALYLSDICKSVSIIIRRNQFRGDNILVSKLIHKNINVIKDSKIIECIGNGNKLTGVKINNHDHIFEMDIDALFVAIGSDKNDKILIDCLGNDYINKLPDNVKLCGDLANDKHQAVIAAGSGANVALNIIDLFK